MTEISGRKRKMRDRRVKEGLCARCGKPRNSTGTAYYCRPCANDEADRQRLSRKKISKPGPIVKSHDPAKAAKRTRNMRHQRIANGLCVDCCTRRAFNSTRTRCRSCADDHAEKQKIRRERALDPYGSVESQFRNWQRDYCLPLVTGQITPVVIWERHDERTKG
jgi:hypothetical protein